MQQKWRMFSKMIGRAVWFRKLPTIVAVLAIVLGVGVIGGLVNLYYDMSQQMSKEFRAYGANVVVYSTDRGSIGQQTLQQITQQIPQDILYGIAPMQYSLVNMENKPLVLVGTWFDQVKKVSPYWQVEGTWVNERDNLNDAMVGVAVARKFDLKPGSHLEIQDQPGKRQIKVRVSGIVTTGGKEENQIFVSTSLAEKLTGRTDVNVVMVSLMEKGSELEQKAEALQKEFNDIAVKPLKQMGQSEAKLLDKIRKLISVVSIIIFVTTVLTITTTMMSMVMERRKEVGLKKALGVPDSKLIVEFLAEGVLFCVVGSSLGIFLAYYLAQVIGQSVFSSAIAFRPLIVPWSYAGSLIVIAIAFVIPVKRMMEVEPAVVLKGE